jgi:hypothetical protein
MADFEEVSAAVFVDVFGENITVPDAGSTICTVHN